MSPLIESLRAYALPEIRSRKDRLILLQFCYALTVAHRPLLEAAKLPELFEQEEGKAAWICADIRAMGGTPPEFDYTAACLIGSQYYVLLHVHPRAVLGYFAALECCALAPLVGDWMEHAYGCSAPTEEDVTRFPIVPMIELIAIQDRWLGGHIIHNAQCTAAGITNVLKARLAEQHAPLKPEQPTSL